MQIRLKNPFLQLNIFATVEQLRTTKKKYQFLGRIQHLRGPGPSQRCGAPVSPHSLSMELIGHLFVNYLSYEPIDFAFSIPYFLFPFFSSFFFFFSLSLSCYRLFWEASSMCGAPLGTGLWVCAQWAPDLEARHSLSLFSFSPFFPS